jgi:hypothetical protein
VKITIEVQELERPFMFREDVGSGICEGYDFELASTIPGRSLYLELDGKTFLVESSEVVQAVVLAYIKRERERASAD